MVVTTHQIQVTIKLPSVALFQSHQHKQQSYFTNPPKVPQMSVAPKVIQGSGMTTSYASNPTNYTPKATSCTG